MRILHLLCLAIPLLLVACGDLQPTTMPETAPCGPPRAAPERYAALTPGGRFDGVTFWYVYRREWPNDGWALEELTPTGRPCAGASDVDACRREVRAMADEQAAFAASDTDDWGKRKPGWLAPMGSWADSQRFDFAIVTSGETRTLVTEERDLAGIVAPIESVDEAVALYRLVEDHDYGMDCGARNLATTAEGWIFRREESSCGREEFLHEVRRDGTIVQVLRKRLEEPHTCAED